MLYKSGINLGSKLKEFLSSCQNVFIYVPYIKLEVLKELFEGCGCVQAVFVRWKPRDLITGASDIEIYPYLKSRNISLYRNPRLHLKAFVDTYKSAFWGSANISSRALNIPVHPYYNYELGSIEANLTFEDRLYFSLIENESILITDHIYDQLLSQLPKKVQEFPQEEDFTVLFEPPDKDFLISSLPMSYTVETLIRIYQNMDYENDLELNCATHDLANYCMPLGLSNEEFITKLKTAFFKHPFIARFTTHLDNAGELYFGTVKEWIQRHCTDVPTPRRWEITENIQILYSWINYLSDGKYRVDRPNYSERIFCESIDNYM